LSVAPAARAAAPLRADELLELLEGEGVTHVIGLPDNDTAPLLDRLGDHARIRLVRVAREGEAFAIASGLWLGGATPVVVIQNTGLLEAGDALRGTASRMGVPLVMLVGYRGYEKMRAAGLEPSEARSAVAGSDGAGHLLSRDDLVRPDVDGVALMTEPTLSAWGVPFERLGGAHDSARVSEAFMRARAEERPVALLLTHTLG
jgi:hypothetical protein